ncbi:hypothetical protein JL720_3383 [Aureococcus anophagefferens]|nr:hypothetical protein JL720_3383 [Aureococcus anophagefferens]
MPDSASSSEESSDDDFDEAAPAEKPQRRSSIYRDDGKADLRAVVRLIKACNLFSKGFGADDAAAKKSGPGSGRLADGGSRGSSRLSSRAPSRG